MKKGIIKYIIACLLLFAAYFPFNSKLNAGKPQTGAGQVCINVTLYHCIWWNDDNTIDYWTFGIWKVPEE